MNAISPVFPLLRGNVTNMLRRPIQLYQEGVKKKPVVTKFLVGGMLGGAGDLIVQWRNEKIDARRLTAFTVFNGFFQCGPNHIWFGYLERGVSSIVRKVAMQHLLFNPFVYLPMFYLGYGSMLGMSVNSSMLKAKSEALRVYSMLLATWVPVSIVQFKFIPVAHQVTFVAGVNVAWNAILSLNTANSNTTDKVAADQEATELPEVLAIEDDVCLKKDADDTTIIRV